MGQVQVRKTRHGGEIVDVQVREGSHLGVVFAAFEHGGVERGHTHAREQVGVGSKGKSDARALVAEIASLTGRSPAAVVAGAGLEGMSDSMADFTTTFASRLEQVEKALVVTRAASGCPAELVVAAGDRLLRVGDITAADLCQSAARRSHDPLGALRQGLKRAVREGSKDVLTAAGENVRVVKYRFERFPGASLSLPTSAWDIHSGNNGVGAAAAQADASAPAVEYD